MTTPLPRDVLPWSEQEFEARLRERESGYHIHHPFNQRLNRGELQPFQVRGWVANRFYYQLAIPMKDAAILSNCPDREVRREWIERLLDHDGRGDHQGANAGGIEAWTRLGLAVGLTREALWSCQHVLPGVRFAVDAYVNFARRAPWQEAAISSLTELFAPKIHKERIAGMLENYDFVGERAMQYFKRRLSQADRDSDFALDYVKRNARTPAEQQAAIAAVRFKCNVLWAQLDALHHAYVTPGLIPPGAFRPGEA